MMKKALYLLFISVFMLSCGAKESKTKTIPEKKVEEVIAPIVTESVPEPMLVFTVQVGANKKESAEYASLEDVQIFKENGFFKYRLGSFESYKEARVLRKKIIKHYPDAFIQAVIGKESISIQEALK